MRCSNVYAYEFPSPSSRLLLVQKHILEGRKEVMLQTKLTLKMKKSIISCKNEEVGEILVIIILFMFDETFFAEWFYFESCITKKYYV